MTTKPTMIRHQQSNVGDVVEEKWSRTAVAWKDAVPVYAALVGKYGFMFGFSLWALVWLTRNGAASLPSDGATLVWLVITGIMAGMCGAGFGGLLAVILKDLAYPYRIESQQIKPAPLPAADFPVDERRELEIKTVRGRAVIVQPRPGAFASWLKDVLNPDNRVTFSSNEAKRREWEPWMYTNLVAQLKGIGWLHPERRLNGAPDVDAAQLAEMKEWLQTPLL